MMTGRGDIDEKTLSDEKLMREAARNYYDDQGDTARAWEAFRERIEAGDSDPAPAPRMRRPLVKRVVLWSAAAATAAAITVAILLPNPTPVPAPAAGTASAFVLRSYDRLMVVDAEGGIFAVVRGETVADKAGVIAVWSGDRLDFARRPGTFRVVVPRGENLPVGLPDGTLTWLNSMSSMIFSPSAPVRSVDLEGEAYFKVASDPSRPFTVHTPGGDVRVLGTQFNVSAYPGSEPVRTTLVEGSVRVECHGGAGLTLEPSYQASFNGEMIELRKVDPNVFTCWKDGMLMFEDQPLERIMEHLVRYYDINPVFEDRRSAGVLFGFRLPRYGSVEPILDLVAHISEVEIRREGKTLYFRHRL